LGVKSVAVYSDADARAPHVKLADEAHHIGPAPAAESYLNIQKIIAAAQACGAEAVHPGYGFLSENPAFSEEVTQAGLVFVGPPPQALRALGSKTSARRLLAAASVPCVPWTELSLEEPERAREAAVALGLPLMVKASAAGGGIGSSVVRQVAQLPEAMEIAGQVAQRFFNSSQIHLERYVELARHVEIQVLADHHGNYIHLLERECSLQRRYQKVVEESPSMMVSPLLRQRLAAAALRVMKAGRYVNAGTVEFLVDDQGNFYFLEVNSRIQVEHPVTELITGVDMVEQQLRVASGQKLAISQDQVRGRGHAIEARIYAEDPETFLPTPGPITKYREPSGPGVRVDSGVCQGYEVSSYYDPMLAKLIVWGETRGEAIGAMVRALQDFVIEGLTTNIPLLSKIAAHPAFLSGEYHTTILTPEFAKAPVPPKPGVDLSQWWRFGR
jgi:acetyl/propionyl-CoA carboxylase alpha subunit